MRSLIRRSVCLLLALAAASLISSAQTNTATVSGIILDPSNATVENARVEALNADTGVSRTTISGNSGVYALTGLPIGRYSIKVNAPGFQPAEWPSVELQVGENRTLDAYLNLSSATATVQVEDSAATLDQTSAAVGGVVTSTQVHNLPLNGRNWSSLMSLVPGAIDSGTNNQRSIRFAGRGQDDNNYRFDGVDATGILNQSEKGNIRLQFSTEAIAEFRANSALYSAEYGGTQGGQVDVVSRTGTNNMHGSLFEFLRNSAFDARGPFDGRNLQPFRLNQFGGSFGGPVVKNRDFFFFTYEGLRQRVGQTLIGFVPSAAFRAQVQAVSPALSSLLASYPAGAIPTADPNTGKFIGSGRQVSNEDSGLFRYDHKFSDSMLLYVRYNIDDTIADVPNGSLLDRTATLLTTHNATISLQNILSPRTLNEVKAGFNRADFSTQNESVSNIALVASPFSTLNDGTGKIQASNTFSGVETLSSTRGAHNLKAGVEVRRVQINATATSSPDNQYTFANAAAFLNNRLTQASLVDTLPTTGLRRTETFGYVEDEFRITPYLTANLGVRYEYFGVPSEVAGRGIVFDPLSCPGGYCPAGTSFYKPDGNNFSPRVSLAWSPSALHNRTVIRTGYGIYYGDGQVGDLTAPVDNLAGRVLLTGKAFPTLSYPVTPFLSQVGFSAAAPRALDLHRRTPYTQDWGLSVQQALSRSTVFTLGYIGNKGTDQFTRTYLNTINPLTGIVPYPGFGLIDYKSTHSNSTFHGLQASLQRNLSAGLLASANYLWSHSINDGATGGGEAVYPQNVNCRACERASSDQDIRQYFSGSMFYDLPFGKGRRFLTQPGLLSTLFGGWQWSNIFTARSGRPVNITLSRSAAAVPDGNTSSPQRPDVQPGQSVETAHQTPQNYLNNAAFSTPAAGTFGNAGRNLGRGPALWQLDTALLKEFALTERFRLTFRAEAFNLFNRAQLGDPSGNYSAGVSFGQITSAVNTTGIGTGTPRELQFALRLDF